MGHGSNLESRSQVPWKVSPSQVPARGQGGSQGCGGSQYIPRGSFRGGPGRGAVRHKILHGWVRGKETGSGSACSKRFSAGSRGEGEFNILCGYDELKKETYENQII